MALFMKQDFTPPLFSRKWIIMKFRPNMLIYSREHIISILESGLLFREDNIEVEQEAPSSEDVWLSAGGGKRGWLTRGETLLSVAAVSACFMTFPPNSLERSTLVKLGAYLSLPVAVRLAHRSLSRGSLRVLLTHMSNYLALARRAAACLKEYAALHADIDSLSSVIESMHTLLCRQQSSLSVLMSRASSALLGNAPWLRDDLAWHAVQRDVTDNLMKIHHAFLVVQSTFLKHIAMAHYIPPSRAQKLYKNHNERLYWIHNVLIEHLIQEYKENFESLERMYRLLKNFGTREPSDGKKLGPAVKDNWLYSEVHTGIARACLELKLALNKCNNLDMFLDSCVLNKQEIDLDVLNTDIDNLIDSLTKCLKTAQNSQIRLKKLQSKLNPDVNKNVIEVENEFEEKAGILKLENKEPESKDEVFYFVKTEDDDVAIQPPDDVTTGPGKKEKETTKIVLNELKRKLGKREDIMRERERQALVKTMPELKNNVPEFPRQIQIEEYIERRGYIHKLTKKSLRKKLFRLHKTTFKKNNHTFGNFIIRNKTYVNNSDITSDFYEANANLDIKNILLTVSCENKNKVITRWFKSIEQNAGLDSSGMSEGLSDVEASTSKKTINQAVNEEKCIKFSKRELELTPSSSESDFEFYKEEKQALLNDVRRHRAVRKKKNAPKIQRGNVPEKDTVDESLRPIEYSFGTGMAMASVLQINSNARIPNMVQEEVFIGDGEVSEDSGNDEDA